MVNVSSSPIAGEINLRVASSPFTNVDAVAEWQEAGIEDYQAWVVAANVLQSPIPPGVTLPFRFDVPTSAFGFEAPESAAWGPVGILVDVATSRRSVGVARSFVVYAPSRQIPVKL